MRETIITCDRCGEAEPKNSCTPYTHEIVTVGWNCEERTDELCMKCRDQLIDWLATKVVK